MPYIGNDPVPLIFGLLNTVSETTDATSTTVADLDQIILHDVSAASGSKMKQIVVTDLAAYLDDEITAMPNLVSVGALDTGSITSGFTSIDVGAGAITTTGIITGGTVEATTDTAAGDNAAIGYTSAEGLILTGQGSTNDVTIKNDADAIVMQIATGGTATEFIGNVTVGGNLDVTGTVNFSDNNIADVGTLGVDSIFGDADSNTSITFSGSDVITIATGGTTAMTIDASQNTTLAGTLTAVTSIGIGSAVLTEAEMEKLDGITNGTAAANKAVVLDASKNIGTIGTIASAAITSSGIIKTDDTTEATSTTDGSLQTDGGLSVAKDVVAGDDVKLLSDAAVLSFGADAEVTLTHVHNDGLLLNTDMQLQFRDSAINIRSDADGDLDINADDEIELNSTLIDINGNVDVSGTLGVAGVVTANAGVVIDEMTIDADTLTATDTFKIDAAGDITLDAGGGEILLNDDGTYMGFISMNSSNISIKAVVSDKDIVFLGNDGGSAITALTLDMSAAGKATFNDGIVATTADFSSVATATTFEPDGDTAAGDNAAIGYTSVLGLILTGQGSTNDVTIVNDADTTVMGVATGTTTANFAGQVTGTGFTGTLDGILGSGTAAAATTTTLAATTGTFSGILKTDDATEATSTTDGSLQTDGGLSVAKDIVAGDDIKLLSDASVVALGADGDVTLTHVHNTGILLNSTNVIQFNDASQNIGAPSATVLDINATDEIELNATLVDVNANLDVSGTITSGGVITGTAFTAGSAVLAEAELELLDGLTAGTAIASKVVTTDANIDSTGMRNLTISGEIDAATGDFSGDVDIDGTLEADAITVNGTALAEVISDTVGAMVGSNTETGIAVTYEDGDNTIDFALDAAQTTITSLLATDIKIGEDDQTKIDFETADEIHFYAANAHQIKLVDGALVPVTDNDIDLGTSSAEFKNAFFDGTVTSDAFAGPLTGNVTGTASLATVTNSTANTNFPVVFNDESDALLDDTGALRYNPSTGTLLVPNLVVAGTTSTVDTVTMEAENAIVFEGATADDHETTLTIIDPTADRTINLPNQSGTIPVLAAASNTAVTSTPEELNILDGVTATAAEINLIDGGTSRGTTAVADGDGILINDAGTMRMTTVQTVSAYMAAEGVGGGNIVTTGALNSGTITSGFGNINTGSSTITTTGAVATGALTAGGILKTDDTTAATSTTDGSLQTDGGLSVAADAVIGDDLFMLSDAAQVTFGANKDVTLTHVHNTGLLVNAAMVVQFRDSAINIGSPADGDLDINADDEIELNSTLIDVNGNLDVSGTIVGASTLSATTGTFSGVLKTDDTTAATSTTDGSLQTDGGLSVAADAVIGDDLFMLSDAAQVTFGADKDVTLTHVADTGLLVNAAMVVQFRDSAINIGSPADGDLDINADDEIELNSTLIDINGNVEISGTLAQADTVTMATNKKIQFRDTAIHISSTADGDLSIAADDEIDLTSTLIDINGNVTISGTTGAAAVTTSTIVASGIIKTDDTTAATSTTDGSLQTDGGLSVALDAVIGDDIIMLSDGAVMHFGTNSEVTLTHVHNVGLTITHTGTGDNLPVVLQLKSEEDAIVANEVIASIEFAAGDSGGTDGAGVAAGIHAIAEDTFTGSANATKLVFTTGVSETAASSATAKMTLSSAGLLTIADDLVIKDGGTIGVASDADSMTIASNGVVTFSQIPLLPDNTVSTADIQADAVTGAKIADDTINSEHYAAGSIDNEHIADDAINSEHYAAGSIDTAHIADAQITVGKMAANSVDSNQYVDGSIDTAHIADNQVTEAKMANDSVGSAEMKTLSTLLIINAAGSTVKTLHGAGA